MPAEIVSIEGLDKVMKKLDKLADDGAFKRPMNQAVQHLIRRVAKYPPQKHGRSQPFVSLRQRRYFFWALASGKIQVPYRRTNTLGRKWTPKVSTNGRRGEVGNNTGYGPFVQGSRQSRFHAGGGWKTVENIAESEAGAVVGYFEKEYKRLAR